MLKNNRSAMNNPLHDLMPAPSSPHDQWMKCPIVPIYLLPISYPGILRDLRSKVMRLCSPTLGDRVLTSCHASCISLHMNQIPNPMPLHTSPSPIAPLHHGCSNTWLIVILFSTSRSSISLTRSMLSSLMTHGTRKSWSMISSML